MMTKSALKALAVVVNVLMTSAEVPTDGVGKGRLQAVIFFDELYEVGQE